MEEGGICLRNSCCMFEYYLSALPLVDDKFVILPYDPFGLKDIEGLSHSNMVTLISYMKGVLLPIMNPLPFWIFISHRRIWAYLRISPVPKKWMAKAVVHSEPMLLLLLPSTESRYKNFTQILAHVGKNFDIWSVL